MTSKESLAALAKAQAEIDELKAELETVRTEPPPGAERLAQGDNKFSLPVYAHGTWDKVGGYSKKTIGAWTKIEMTWNRAFGYLGLRMMQEADEPTLESDLCAVAEFDNSEHVRSVFADKVSERAEAAGVPEYRRWFRGVEVSDEDFQTILLQFDALGLIQHSKRSRSVKDTANYWTLTPFGHTQLVQLRALQTGEETLLREEEIIGKSEEDLEEP